MRINANNRLLFIGDSITDCGRKRPVGDGTFDRALGDGYVSLVDATLTTAYSDYTIRVMNTGVAGDTVRDLKARWGRDVLALGPDWLSIMIGINDVWRQFDGLWGLGKHISVEEYTHTLHDLIGQARPHLQGLILMTPYYLEPDRGEPMRALMDQFGAAVSDLAAQHDAIFIDTQAAFDGVLQHLRPVQLAHDRIHLNLAGHMILAQAFLQAIGYEWGRSMAAE